VMLGLPDQILLKKLLFFILYMKKFDLLFFSIFVLIISESFLYSLYLLVLSAVTITFMNKILYIVQNHLLICIYKNFLTYHDLPNTFSNILAPYIKLITNPDKLITDLLVSFLTSPLDTIVS